MTKVSLLGWDVQRTLNFNRRLSKIVISSLFVFKENIYSALFSFSDKTVIKFSAKAFKQPSEYLDVEDNVGNATRFMKYMNYKSLPFDEVTQNIRNTIQQLSHEGRGRGSK